MANNCKMCGACCKLFFINLNKEEYESGEFQTVFANMGEIENFSEARKCGAIFVAKKENGECIYLDKNACSIHKNRPHVCKGFFCTSKNKKYAEMRIIVEKWKLINLKDYCDEKR